MNHGEILELPSYCGKNPVLIHKSAKYPGIATEWIQKRLHSDGTRSYYCKHCRESCKKPVKVVRYENGKFSKIVDHPNFHVCGFPNDSHLYVNIRENRKKTEVKRVAIQTDNENFLMFFDGFKVLTEKYSFEVIQILGQGYFGKVAQVQDLKKNNKKCYALKISKKEKTLNKSAENEVKMFEMLKKSKYNEKQ